MNENEIKEVIKITVAEAVHATTQASQSIINTYINAIEDTWQESDAVQKAATKATVELLVSTLTEVSNLIEKLTIKFPRVKDGDGPTNR